MIEMATKKKTDTVPAPQVEPATVEPELVEEAVAPDPDDDATATDDAAPEPQQTTDYTRRAGGHVLTDHGWVLETRKGH